MAGGGLAACARDWARGRRCSSSPARRTARPVLDPEWVAPLLTPPLPWLEPGRLPSSITTHAGFGYHWWPLDADGVG